MNTDELREAYLSFFESKGCVRKPSDVLVPHGDKSVLFTPAGMNQFKNQFLGIGPLEFTRATTCQKCIRTGDIENVGNTARHHTFFEMLGNFSFGDYFKKEAIHWAWEFLTSKKWLKLDPTRLTVTVYLDDDEAYNIWHNEVGLPPDRIKREDEAENFWPASAPSQGPDGVCGPCSEIYFHMPGSKGSVEIWNLVFTQFNRVGNPPNNLQPLPKNNIDTGMGLERTAAVIQGVESNFENDLLKPLCLAAAEAVGIPYSYSAPEGRPIRRIADHVRCVTFCIHEGVGPGNEMQGYIVKQLLRRALLEGYLLGQQEPFVHTLVPSVVEAMGKAYPDLRETVERVQLVIKAEEENFLNTVDRGLHKVERLIHKAGTNGVIPGDEAFDLHQTDGFLIEMTTALAARSNVQVDRAGYEEARKRHKIISNQGGFSGEVMKGGPLAALRSAHHESEFLGYETLVSQGRIIGIIAEKQLVEHVREQGHTDKITVVLDRSPFYGESGGQVGDIGTLEGDTFTFDVQDTQKAGGFILHSGHIKKGELAVGKTVTARVDETRRAGIRRAHSATHLLHHALQRVLGSHATQRGSKVDNDELRFDFTQPTAITKEQLRSIEDIINTRVAEAAPVRWDIMDLESARSAGAMALFGERYPERVRVVTMGEFSRELCGGTHLSNTGQVGFCRVVSDESVSAGTRRITAVTGPKAISTVREEEQLLAEVAHLLKAPRAADLPHRVTALIEEVRTLKRDMQKLQQKSSGSVVDDLLAKAQLVNGVSVVASLGDWNADQIRAQIDEIRKRASTVAVLLGSALDGKVVLIAGLSKDLVARGLSAGDWVKAAAKAVGGSGGGRPDLAQAGGKSPEKLEQALADGIEYLRAKLS